MYSLLRAGSWSADILFFLIAVASDSFPSVVYSVIYIEVISLY